MSNFLQHIAIMEAPHDTCVTFFTYTQKNIMDLGKKLLFQYFFISIVQKLLYPIVNKTTCGFKSNNDFV